MRALITLNKQVPHLLSDKVENKIGPSCSKHWRG